MEILSDQKNFWGLIIEIYEPKIGFKGSAILDAGYVYAPYIPLQLTGDPIQPHGDIMSKYATKMIDSKFYGAIRLHE